MGTDSNSDQGQGDQGQARLEAIADALSVGRLERHIFLCADGRTSACAERGHGRSLWRYMEKRSKALGWE